MRVEKQPEERKPEVFISPQPLGKIGVLIVLIVAGTVLFWFTWATLLNRGVTLAVGSRNIGIIVWTLLAFCLMCCLWAISSAMVTKKLVVLLMAVLASATAFIFFRPSVWSLVGAVLMLLGFLYWYREITADLKSRIKFMPTRTVGTGVKTAVSLMLLAMSFMYYSFLVTGPDATKKFTDSLLSSGTRAVQNILLMYYKDKYQPHMPLDTFILNLSGVTDEELRLNTGQPQLDETIGQGLSRVQAAAVAKAREDFLKTFDIQASGDEEMQSVVEKIVRRNMDKYIGQYTKFIPAILALGLFFLLNIFNFVYSELIKSLSYLLFHVLVWTKFIKVRKVQVEAEKITL